MLKRENIFYKKLNKVLNLNIWYVILIEQTREKKGKVKYEK